MLLLELNQENMPKVRSPRAPGTFERSEQVLQDKQSAILFHWWTLKKTRYLYLSSFDFFHLDIMFYYVAVKKL